MLCAFGLTLYTDNLRAAKVGLYRLLPMPFYQHLQKYNNAIYTVTFALQSIGYE